MLKQISFFAALFFFTTTIWAQPDRWQQRAEYKIDIDFDVNKHQFSGKQRLKYFNNSPDELDRVFYHLYFNAFQPNSIMHIRTETIKDGDPRVKGRIGKLKENEIGYHHIKSLKMDGKDCRFEVVGTVLEVDLPKAIAPSSSVVFEMEFDSQVPLQIRRSGRMNKEGIDYSMTQWYPKMAEYDYQGWHADPYVGREFYGIWSDFEVNITMPRKYMVAASGVLQNPAEIGMGYEPAGTAVRPAPGDDFTWKFKAEKVHDFAWAADPDYTHTKLERKDGLTLHFFYIENENTKENWEALPRVMSGAFDFINKNFGQYPYKSYAYIQGGDGGMEYPMATLITGERTMSSLIGVCVHEMLHAWYYGLLGTNEALYPWMDEGFTEYATAETENYLMKENLMPGKPKDDPHIAMVKAYVGFAKSGLEEPLSTHADHFNLNQAYGVAAYVKGHVFLTQLQYIMGKPTFDRAFLRYFNTWKFKHPNPNDFIRIMEKESGLELDWFKEYFVYTTRTIDYGISKVEKANRKETRIVLENKIGNMPMPLDVVVTTKDGTVKRYNIPLQIMRGEKKSDFYGSDFVVLPDWPWTHPVYEFTIDEKFKKIASVQIDPSERLADVVRENNVWGEAVEGLKD